MCRGSEKPSACGVDRDRTVGLNGQDDSRKPRVEPSRRTRIWEWTDEVHCSVLGTCASIDDLRRLARKLGIAIRSGATDYQIHGYFVVEAARETRFARAFQKLMDQRYAGAIRRVAAVRSPDDMTTLWADMRNKGQIAAAYWAFMSHGHVPLSLRAAIFGDVHMLSHLAGAQYRSRIIEAVALRDQIQDAKDRASRVEAGLHETLRRQDEEITRLREQNTRLRGQLSVKGDRAMRASVADGDKAGRRFAKLERALIVARFRARSAEERLRASEGRSWPGNSALDAASAVPASRPAEEASSPAPVHNRTFLYLGGRSGQIDHLRRIAAEHEARLIHHDGGMEEAVLRIDALLPSVDCVLCPVNCVSHDACQRAKRACKLLGKPFLPLRSASQASFRAAIRRYAAMSREPSLDKATASTLDRTG